MKNEKKKIVYSEPIDYFPEDIRRKHKLGEFAEQQTNEENSSPADYGRWGRVGIVWTSEPTIPNINKANIQQLMDRFKLYIEKYSGHAFSSFESNEFLYEQEGYKTDIYRSVKQLLIKSKIKESDIGTGKINAISTQIIKLSKNLVNVNQIIHFNNIIAEYPQEAERVMYDIYYCSSEKCAFENAVKLFGGKYDLIAYLFFTKDYTRFLPIRSTEFDKRFRALGINFSTAYKCSWENYTRFISIISSIRDMMEEYYGASIRLIDAHSLVWQSTFINNMYNGNTALGTAEISFDSANHRERDSIVIASSRIGQGVFRRGVVSLWNASCSVTDCTNEEFLIASHIKPWAVCTENNEWINPYNGLLLTPNLDKAFDKGYISFDVNGNILISHELNERDLRSLNISTTMKLKRVFVDSLPFLEYHRTYIFRR